jgi:DNA-binding HxlR family transcriptional regulator
LETTLLFLGTRERALVLWSLFWGPKTFPQLMRSVRRLTRRGLGRELLELERLGLLSRSGAGREEYVLSSFGETLKPLVAAMYEWGLFVRRRGGSGPAAGPSLGEHRRSDPLER